MDINNNENENKNEKYGCRGSDITPEVEPKSDLEDNSGAESKNTQTVSTPVLPVPHKSSGTPGTPASSGASGGWGVGEGKWILPVNRDKTSLARNNGEEEERKTAKVKKIDNNNRVTNNEWVKNELLLIETKGKYKSLDTKDFERVIQDVIKDVYVSKYFCDKGLKDYGVKRCDYEDGKVGLLIENENEFCWKRDSSIESVEAVYFDFGMMAIKGIIFKGVDNSFSVIVKSHYDDEVKLRRMLKVFCNKETENSKSYYFIEISDGTNYFSLKLVDQLDTLLNFINCSWTYYKNESIEILIDLVIAGIKYTKTFICSGSFKIDPIWEDEKKSFSFLLCTGNCKNVKSEYYMDGKIVERDIRLQRWGKNCN